MRGKERFRPLSLLKSGLGVETWLASDKVSGGKAVLRTAAAERATALLQQECRVLATVEHPGSARLLDHGRQGRDCWLAREWVEGATLRERLSRGTLRWDEGLRLALGLAEALEAVHSVGVVHRDVKPENLVLAAEGGRPVLLDFALARMGTEDGFAGHLVGTPLYMSPEQAGLVDLPVSPGSDLYSLGLLLAEAWVGPQAVISDTLADALRLRAGRDCLSLASFRPDVPGRLEALVGRLTQTDPRRRYPSARALVGHLERLLHGEDRPLDLAEAPSTLPPSAPFVGRREEVEAIRAEAEPALRGEPGGLVLCEAPAGGGKSRLLEEAALRLRAAGFRVVRARGARVDSGASRSLFDALRREALQDADLAGPWSAVEADLRKRGAASLDLDPARLAGVATWMAERLAPLLVILDDAPRADALTLSVLERLRQPGVAVLCGGRPEEADALSGVGWTRRLPLPPFTQAEVAEAVRGMAGTCPEELERRILELGGGNPLLTQEALHLWWGPRSLAGGLGGSDRAGALLRSRVATLDHDHRGVLGRAAVLGLSVDLGLLAALEGEATWPALETGARARLARVESDSSTLRFSHERVREALVETVAPEERTSLHRRAARHLESQHPERGQEIALHLAACGEVEAAAVRALPAARAARARLDLVGAEALYEVALRGLPRERAEERAECCAGLGWLEMIAGRYARAVQRLEQGMAEGAGEWTAWRLPVLLGNAHCHGGSLRDSVAWGNRVIEYLGERIPARPGLAIPLEILKLSLWKGGLGTRPCPEPLAAMANCAFATLTAYGHSGQIDVAVWASLRSANQLRRYAPSSATLRTMSIAVVAMAHIGQAGLARRWFGPAAGLLDSADDDWDRGRALARLGAALLYTGELARARTTCDEAARLLSSSGDRWEIGSAQYHALMARSFQGSLPEHDARRAWRSAVELQDAQLEVGLRHLLHLAGLRLERGLPQAPESGNLMARMLDSFCEGLDRLLEGEAAAAVRHLEESVRTLPIERGGFYRTWASLWLAHALRLDGRREEARRHLGTVRRHWSGHPGFRPMLLREEALLALGRGHGARARTKLRESVAEARRLGMRWEEALSLQESGLAGEALGWPGAADAAREGDALRLRLGRPGRAHLPGVIEAPPENLASSVRLDLLVNAAAAMVDSEGARVEVLRAAEEAGRRVLLGSRTEVLVRRDGAWLHESSGAPPGLGTLPEEAWASGTSSTWAAPPGETDGPGALAACPVRCRDGQSRVLLAWRDAGLPFSTQDLKSLEAVGNLLRAALDRLHAEEGREKALRRAEVGEERFRALFESAGNAVLRLSADGRILQWNHRTTEMLRLDPGTDLAGRSVLEFLGPESRAGFQRRCREVLHHGGNLRGEVRYLREGGLPAWALVTWAAWRGEGGQGLVCTLTDVSLRRLETLVRMQEQERHMLSCELHDEVAQVASALRLGLELRVGRSPEADLEDLAGQARHLEREIESLLALLRSPFEDGASTVDALRNLASRCDPAWDVDLALDARIDQAPRRVQVAVYRVIQEALRNAGRHARASRVRVWVRVSGRSVLGGVQDDGVGLHPPSAGRRRPAYGLRGMRWRCEVLGGRLRVRSAPGGGTEIRFRLPWKPAEG